jgi:putative DNA primase/helicase
MTIDLSTGLTRDSQQLDYITKIAGTYIDKSMDVPVWGSFLDRITGGDVELQAYLQRVAGYCTTGLTTEHVLFFLYGTGANGKSVFVNTLAGIWGDYHVTAPTDTFIESKNDRHPTDLAMLQGARLVTAQETEKGRHWAEAKIKMLTGGDRVSARFMRGDFFTYIPQFKLMISGNHKPSLRSVGEAMRRRIHLVPFDVTIPPHEPDPQLSTKLKGEWPGILAWAVEGCIAWQRLGLAPPPAVTGATDEYLAAEDDMQAWLDECCVIDPALQEGSGALYESWKVWADRTRVVGGAGSQKAFSQTLTEHGFRSDRRRTGTVFFGLRVNPQYVP